MTDSKGKVVTQVEIKGYADEAEIYYAAYGDGTEVSEAELAHLNEVYQEYVQLKATENAQEAAEYAREYAAGR